MIYLSLIATVVFAVMANLAIRSEQNAKERCIAQLWDRILKLEADNSALTESLVRSQGKTYISTMSGNKLVPSDGWYDSADIVAPKKKSEEN